MAASPQGWSSLPEDLVNRVADCLLATNDLDCYTDLRAVCHHWRRSTADQRSSNPLDPRFRPRRWVMLDERKVASSDINGGDDSALLFVNTATGRFLRRSLPLLHARDRRSDYILVTSTTDGLLVLAAKEPPHAVSVLNPFTGSLIRFAVPLPNEPVLTAEVVGPAASPTLVMASVSTDDVYWAEPQSESFSVERHPNCPASRLPLIAAAKHGAAVGREPGREGNKIFDVLLSRVDCRCYVVWLPQGPGLPLPLAAGGDMLAVFKLKCRRFFAVFKLDAAGNVMERVTSIGSLALFLGVRCLAVDTHRLPTIIEPDCIYFQARESFELNIYGVPIIGTIMEQESEFVEYAALCKRTVSDASTCHFGAPFWGAPFTIRQILCDYTMSFPTRRPTWGMTFPDGYLDFFCTGPLIAW